MNKETDYQPMEDAESTSSKAEAAQPVETGGTVARTVRKWVHKARSGNFIYFLPALLVFYSILKEIKVGEPFMYLYHTTYLHYTAKTLNGEIHPYSVYAYLVAIIPIFLFTDIFLYKPVMYLEVLGQFAYRFTLVFTNNLLSQQIGQACYGIAMASEVAFFSYIYGRLEKNQYKRLTSWTRAGTMAGRTGGYIFAQITILTETATYLTLNKIAFYVPIIAIVLCFLMPRVSWKTLVDRVKESRERKISRKSQHGSIRTKPKPSNKKIKTHSTLPTSYKEFVVFRFKKLRSDFVKIYSNGYIRKWSFWWAMTTCMALQVALYGQTMIGTLQVPSEKPLNAAADGAYTFLATVAILGLNSLPIDWDKWGEFTLFVISGIDAVFLLVLSQSPYVWPMYGAYVGYRSFYQVMITIAQWNIAKKMVCDSYGLVFGVNSFIALILQSLLTRIVTDSRGLGLQVKEAFLVYACLHAIISFIFLSVVIYNIITYFLAKRKINATPAASPAPVSLDRKSRSVSINRKVTVVPEPTNTIAMTPLGPSAPSSAAPALEIAPELDYSSSDDDFNSDYEDEQTDTVPVFLRSGMTSESMAANFSASFSNKA